LQLRSQAYDKQIPANHPVMMAVYDLAAQYNVPVHLHYQPDYGTLYLNGLAELEDALAANPNTIFVWGHWWHHSGAEGGLRSEVRQLLNIYPNLYLQWEFTFPPETFPNFLTDLQNYSDRLIFGTDVGMLEEQRAVVESGGTTFYQLIDNVRGFELLLPVGISFYTFQSLSYSIDVYRGVRPPEKHLGIFALYVAFFPQLVAGPIERATTLLPQLRKTHEFDYERVTDGLKLMAWGMFKKVVIADRLAILVNTVYQNPTDYQGVPLIIATYFFAFQIYCDFSGYSDIAIGAAQVMGYKLMDNFKRPYFSTSIAEFWRRWHISLSTWFKDYLYIPLGGNRVVKWRWYVNLYVVFLISGLWHGANWTFVVWGAIHGFYLVFSIWTANFRRQVSAFFRLNRYPTIQNCWKVFITFHLVLFAWVFFRANTLQDAFYIVSHLFSNLEFKSSYGLELGRFEFAVAIFSILLMEFIHLIQSYQPIRPLLSQKPVWLRWGVYYVFVMALLMFGEFASPQAFVYFQF
jgi:alginate O-acetyltransferase complex protein AlgI